jgi:cysteinyl-tRNA synthetase
MTRKKEEFKPLQKGKVSLYTCGPTVYDYAHIGNLRTYVWQDVLKRYLLYLGYKVKHAMNITDVEDKIIKRSQEQNVPAEKLTFQFTQAFMNDADKLNILPADNYPKATEYIQEIVELVERLMKKEIAYKGEDGSIYFSIKKFPAYGNLSNINVKELKKGARVNQDEYTKDNASDFVLWKAWTEKDGNVFWETPLGKGRPGWHIECSVMSEHALGLPIDIHTGGVDLLFPHHENEIAQIEGAVEQQFVRYWMHAEHLLVKGKKMSKSVGNFYTLRELEAFNPLAIRFALLEAQYRQQLNFSKESVKNAQQSLQRIQEFIERLQETQKGKIHQEITDKITETQQAFEAAMNDDFNIPLAISKLFSFITSINKEIDKGNVSKHDAENCTALLEKLNSVLGFIEFETEEIQLTKEEQALITKREDYRKAKEFAKADAVRDTLKKQGIELSDLEGKVKARRIKS